ncbi:hypothetical protein [Natronosalvus vescus]|uniref:hypothetical protein n=1 Tax=Natronosalvus vescus TaxID=2953881 RepID=UPI0020913FCC|nr:hypothetical protein [Natronosalvus vescus]
MIDIPSDGNERLAVVGGALLIASAFLPWASIDVLGTTTTSNGFSGMGYLAPLAGAISLWVVYMREWTAFETKVTTAVGALTVLSLGVLYTSLENVFAAGYPAHYVTVSPEPGIFVAFLASALVTVGGYRGMRAVGDDLSAREAGSLEASS